YLGSTQKPDLRGDHKSVHIRPMAFRSGLLRQPGVVAKVSSQVPIGVGERGLVPELPDPLPGAPRVRDPGQQPNGKQRKARREAAKAQWPDNARDQPEGGDERERLRGELPQPPWKEGVTARKVSRPQ